MKSVFLSLCAVLLLVGVAFAASPNAIIVPTVPVTVISGSGTVAPDITIPVRLETPVVPAAPTQAKILADLQATSVLIRVTHGSGSGTLVTHRLAMSRKPIAGLPGTSSVRKCRRTRPSRTCWLCRNSVAKAS